jgi:N-acyl-L-homoserine lactone synthetase
MTIAAFRSTTWRYQTIGETAGRCTTAGGGRKLSHSKTIPIRLASTAEELETIYQFRYRIYVDEMHWRQFYADRSTRRIEDPLDRGGYNFGAFQGDEVVGVVRVNFPRTSSIAYYETFLDMRSADRFHPSATSMCTRLMVAPRMRGTNLAMRLAQVSYEFCLLNRIRYNFMDCDDHLIRFFTRLGYIIRRRAEHPEYGMGNVMRLDLLDRARLAQTRSPFLAILDEAMGRGDDASGGMRTAATPSLGRSI